MKDKIGVKEYGNGMGISRCQSYSMERFVNLFYLNFYENNLSRLLIVTIHKMGWF